MNIAEIMHRYTEIKDQITKGNLKIFRNELIHVLYKKHILFIKSFMNILANQSSSAQEDTLSKYSVIFDHMLKQKMDFCTDEFPIYKKELNYLDQVIKGFKGMTIDCIKLVITSDQTYQNIMSDSSIQSLPQTSLFSSPSTPSTSWSLSTSPNLKTPC